MGCQWSDQKAGFSSLDSGIELDPVEEHLHIKAWKDPQTRTHKMIHDGEDGVLEVSKIIRESMKVKAEQPPAPAAPGGASGVANDFWTGGHAIPAVMGEGAGGVEGGESNVKERLAALEREQDQARKREMLKVDPACWRGYAEQGYFQKAEDLLRGAYEAEEEFVGKTTRWARLKYSLGELYDHRSNVDVTGQQQALSLKSALYAQSAVDMLEAEGGEQSEAAQRGELLAMSLLLRGRGLCNFALDGDSESMQAKQAFEVAEQDLMRSVAMMEGAGSDRTAKAMMSVGYLHYCKAGCTMNTEVSSMNQVISTPEDSHRSYSKAEEYYVKSLALYNDVSGESSEDSIRMMCNLALVKNSMSKLPLETKSDNLQEAKMWYERALELQTKAFGKRHDRTLRIQEDLADVLERERVEKGDSVPTEPKRSGTDQEREMQASLLMEEFLTARRRERQQEQTSMVQDLQIRAAKPKGADADDDEITAKLSLL